LRGKALLKKVVLVKRMRGILMDMITEVEDVIVMDPTIMADTYRMNRIIMEEDMIVTITLCSMIKDKFRLITVGLLQYLRVVFRRLLMHRDIRLLLLLHSFRRTGRKIRMFF
jgi:hypothetical protein